MANQININRPTTRVVIVSVILAILALVGHFSRVQYLTEYQFWLAMSHIKAVWRAAGEFIQRLATIGAENGNAAANRPSGH
jgi:hypothetical protein